MKVKYGWLQPTNVVQVAQLLLKMDKADFQLSHQGEALTRMCTLEETLCDYLLPRNNERSYSKYSIVEEMEQHMQNLLNQTSYLLALLVPEKRIEIATKSTFVKKEEEMNA